MYLIALLSVFLLFGVGSLTSAFFVGSYLGTSFLTGSALAC